MPRSQHKVQSGDKLGRKLGITAKPIKTIFGPTGHRRKPHNKPLKRPLLGILPAGGKNAFKL